MPEYIVRQGDTTSRIAYENGFFRQTIWDHPRNAALKETRQHHNILLPGDVMFIPEKQINRLSGITDQRHRFRLKGVPEKLRIRLLDQNDEPRGDIPYVLEIEDISVNGTTGSDGLVEHDIPPGAGNGRLRVGESGEEVHILHFGHLDPVNEISGLQARLKNLGIFFGEIDGEMTDETVEGIMEFQHRQGLEETGNYDDDTRAQLEDLHSS